MSRANRSASDRAGRVSPRAPAGLGHSATIDFCGKMLAEQERRHAWLYEAGEQIRRWKQEDAAAGQPWGEDTPREPGAAEKAARQHSR
jgi:hypothetical protein